MQCCTLGVEFKTKIIEVEGKKIKLQLWYSLIFGKKWQINNLIGFQVTSYISAEPTLNLVRMNEIFIACVGLVFSRKNVQFHIICSV